MTLHEAQKTLVTAGVQIDAGLTEDEFATVEQRFGFRFPPDLREFLGYGLPVSEGWVDWRDADVHAIRSRLDWPLEGIFFDIEHNAFWLKEWGERPTSLPEAFEIARRAIAAAPILIPICSHRYIPDEPWEPGNPVFSVHQTDIIYYGANLLDYLQNEFLLYFDRSNREIVGSPRRIRFWSHLEEINGEPTHS